MKTIRQMILEELEIFKTNNEDLYLCTKDFILNSFDGADDRALKLIILLNHTLSK